MNRLALPLLLIPVLLTAACGGGEEEPVGLAVLGYEDDSGAVDMLTIASGTQDLNVPRDLAFDPENPDRLWIVNQADDSVTILFNPGTEDQTFEHRIDPYALHFMEEVSSISFGQPGTFATCQESRNTYNDQGAPNDFMGPALWSSDLDVFASSNPDAIEYLSQLYGTYVDLGSHLDMQHETPLCTGIAWEEGNVYWTFDGLNETIDRVDFQEDHGVGYDDHSDGITATYDAGGITYVEGVSNHMVFDQDTALLYIADPGGGRVMVLDTTAGERGSDMQVTEPGTQHYTMLDTEIAVFADGLDMPSGLALMDGVLFVADYGTGIVHGLDLATGAEIDRLDTGRGPESIMGLTATDIDTLWLTDVNQGEAFRIQAVAEVEE